MGQIYKIINDINNKVYIGQTKRSIKERWSEHLRYAKNKSETCPLLYRAMNKYGIEHFKIEEVEKCSDDELDNKEMYWIEQYNSYPNGYNATFGGAGIKKMGNPVYAYDIKTGNFVIGFDSMREASRWIGKTQYPEKENFFGEPMINDVVHGLNKRKSAYGYIWSLEKKDKVDLPKQVGRCRNKKVLMIDPYTKEIVNIFNSTREAGRFLGNENLSKRISECARGQRNMVEKYIWEYID